jgi:hypothetical protein
MTSDSKTPDRSKNSSYHKRLRAKIAANRRVSAPGYDGQAATKAARLASWAARENRVDPDGELSPDVRHRRAIADFQADMDQAKLRKAARRRSKKPRPRALPARLLRSVGKEDHR